MPSTIGLGPPPEALSKPLRLKMIRTSLAFPMPFEEKWFTYPATAPGPPAFAVELTLPVQTLVERAVAVLDQLVPGATRCHGRSVMVPPSAHVDVTAIASTRSRQCP